MKMLKATLLSLAITGLSLLLVGIVNIAAQNRGARTIGLGALLGYTVLDPVFWIAGVAAFFLAFRYFARLLPR
jgi:ABC-type antimicrobial peptide transport system permease subunit